MLAFKPYCPNFEKPQHAIQIKSYNFFFRVIPNNFLKLKQVQAAMPCSTKAITVLRNEYIMLKNLDS